MTAGIFLLDMQTTLIGRLEQLGPAADKVRCRLQIKVTGSGGTWIHRSFMILSWSLRACEVPG